MIWNILGIALVIVLGIGIWIESTAVPGHEDDEWFYRD